jgi:hypothetical protein
MVKATAFHFSIATTPLWTHLVIWRIIPLAQHFVYSFSHEIRAGGQPFRVFHLDKLSQWDDTTLESQRRVTGFAFEGARSFVFFEGSGF